ncbi:hypothetical protein HK100_003030 [Physocladia obscura]|uniref:Uncharacterized protein n=1 Tax=Physocladia obscura TaxID=109957 RepID=A0AAD5X9P4_9FUNG|nr:hypothetical protein HK100_003030 [Physocladia obscura]
MRLFTRSAIIAPTKAIIRAFTTPTPPAGSTYPYTLKWTSTETPLTAVSFSKISDPASSPPTVDTRVIGWINGPANTLPTPRNFTPNPRFEDFLHSVLKETVHTDVGWQAMAVNQKEGYMTVTDARVFTPWGRVADPEDLVGAVLLKNGKIVEGSYERMPAHRLVSTNGLFQLSETLHAKLIERLALLK